MAAMSRLDDLQTEEQFRRRPLWVRLLILLIYGLIVGYLMYLGSQYAEQTGEDPGTYRT